MFDLARLDKPFDGAGHVFHWHGRIDPVLVQKIDVVGTQALQHGVDDRDDVLGAAVQTAGSRAGLQIDVEAELGRDDDLVAERRHRLAEQGLIGERPIGFSRVEEGDAALEGVADQAHRVLCGRGVAIGR